MDQRKEPAVMSSDSDRPHHLFGHTATCTEH